MTRIAYDAITPGNTIQVIDGPDAGTKFTAEIVFESGTVGVTNTHGERVWFPRCQVRLAAN